MPILIFVSLALVLLVCNMFYCGRSVIVDARRSQRASTTLGVLALSGAMMASVAMVWATLASLAHL
ncbi:hypothetical protein [Sphingomonas pituitosa]|uniref:hypothetical protein n=1 Tax=Sphingomonas pituitosa TaxID=99597 RepID=UPI00082E66F7|nr:hypothetical protein [Sphingomonas pituitosa]